MFSWFGWFQGPLWTPFCCLLEVSGSHFDDFGRYWRLLGISMNSRVSSETPRILRPLPGGGKMRIPRAHYYRQLGGYSIQNTTYSMEHCHTGSKDVNVTCKCKCKWCMKHTLRSLVAPGKQGPADIYIYICVFLFLFDMFCIQFL